MEDLNDFLHYLTKKSEGLKASDLLYKVADYCQGWQVNINTIKTDCNLYLDNRGFEEKDKLAFFQDISGLNFVHKINDFPDEVFVDAFQRLILDTGDLKLEEISTKLHNLLTKSFRIEAIESLYYLMENTSIADKEEFSQCYYFALCITPNIPQFDLVRASKLFPKKQQYTIIKIREKTGELLNKALTLKTSTKIPYLPPELEVLNKPKTLKHSTPNSRKHNLTIVSDMKSENITDKAKITSIKPKLTVISDIKPVFISDKVKPSSPKIKQDNNILIYDEGFKVPFDYSFELVEDDEELCRAIALLDKEKILAIDTETTGLDPHTSKLRLIQIASYHHPTIIIDCFKCNPKLIQPLLLNDSVKVFHNAKFDLQFFFSQGLEIKQKLFDTMLGYQLVNAGKIFRASLKDVAKDLLDIDLDKTDQTSNWNIKNLTQSQLKYASLDAKILLYLREQIRASIVKLNLSTIAKIEFDCVVTVALMEFNGMLLDLGKWDEILEKAKEEKNKLEKTLQKLLPADNQGLFKIEINLNSPKQLLEAFQKIGIECNATDSSTLKQLLIKHPEVIKPLLEYRQLSKLISSFGDKMIQKINPLTGRLHGQYNQLGSTSGRFSAKNPNLQQIPRGKEIRGCFVASPKYKLVIADYSQIELRIAAELTSDKKMIEAYNNDEDLHRLTASIVLNKQLHEVTKEDRQIAKSANFGLIYGSSVNGFRGYAESNYDIKLSEKQAKTIMDNFFKSYAGLAKWHKNTRSMFYNSGGIKETRTKSGRIRYLNQPTIQQLLNTPVQGLGADIVKLALSKLPTALKGFDAKILATVHDEIVLEAHEDIAEEVSHILTKTMVEAGEYFIKRVPMVASANIGNSWADK